MTINKENAPNQEQIKTKVLAIFNACRTQPESPFEPLHFMDFLVAPPSEKHQIRNSFKGANKHGNFLRKIELAFGICFTLADYDTSFTLDEFVKKIEERIHKKASNVKLIKERMNEKNYFIFEIVMLLILSVLYYIFGWHWLPILLSPLLLFAVYWIASRRIKDMLHTKRLSKIILKD